MLTFPDLLLECFTGNNSYPPKAQPEPDSCLEMSNTTETFSSSVKNSQEILEVSWKSLDNLSNYKSLRTLIRKFMIIFSCQ